MNQFAEYIFIYKDSMNSWCAAKNPAFVAMHTKCRAIESEVVFAKYKSEQDLVNSLNDYYMNEKTEQFIRETDLREIV